MTKKQADFDIEPAFFRLFDIFLLPDSGEDGERENIFTNYLSLA